MTRSILLPLLALLAACTPAAEQAPANQPEPAAAEEEAAEVAPLEGEWEVTLINGQPLAQPHPMGASVTGERLTIRSDCVRQAWDYRQDRNIVAFEPTPVPTCGGTRTPDETLAEQAVNQANIAMFARGGDQVVLSGPGGNLTMTRR